jgi:carbamoyltransferase
MFILGINGGVRAGYQDVSTVLLKDGAVVYAIAEERLNRKKHSAGQLPMLGIKEALKFANIQIQDVAFLATHGSTWGEAYEKVLKEYFEYSFGFCPKIVRIHHHLAHAASAYYGSSFDQAMVLTMDASGDGISMQKTIGKNGKLEIIEQISRDNSLGIFYSIMTQFCGFTRDTDEYKLMGLAPYGREGFIDLDEILAVEKEGFRLNESFLKEMVPGAPQGSRQQVAFSRKLIELLGPAKLPFEAMTQHYQDVAASAQAKLNEAIVNTVTKFHKSTGLRKLCLAGGVALNCETNKHLMNLDFIDEIFVQPASGDDGISLGAAWYVSSEMGVPPVPSKNYYLGNAYSDTEIKGYLDLMGLTYKTENDVAAKAAQLVSEDKVVAWFQGRDEFGPRALGARSILGNPCHPEMKALMNAKIKFREGFRPFCPSVLAEDASLHFTGKEKASPYMTINYDVIDAKRTPSIVHVNNTARIQTVAQADNPMFYAYLQNLKQNIGVGMSINTSFNRNQEPMIHNPIEAVSSFYGSGMDALVIGSFILEKANKR